MKNIRLLAMVMLALYVCISYSGIPPQGKRPSQKKRRTNNSSLKYKSIINFHTRRLAKKGYIFKSSGPNGSFLQCSYGSDVKEFRTKSSGPIGQCGGYKIWLASQ